jgi:hypothetical protein
MLGSQTVGLIVWPASDEGGAKPPARERRSQCSDRVT